MEAEAKYLIIIITNVLRYFILAGFAFFIFYKLFPTTFLANKIQQKIAGKKDFIREILYSMQTTLILAAVGIILIHSPLSAYTKIYHDLSAYPLWWIPGSVVLALIIHDTYFYWMHRTVHHPRLYAKVHLIHHKSTNPSPWASYSFHFLEGVIEAMIAPILLFLIPMHPLSLLLFTLVAFAINVYGHLGYEIAPKWFRNTFFFELLNTSVHHNLHHEKVQGNYGLYFRVWDRIMGTEVDTYVAKYDEIQAKRIAAKNFSAHAIQHNSST